MKNLILGLFLFVVGCRTEVTTIYPLKITEIRQHEGGWSEYYVSAIDGYNTMYIYCFEDFSNKFNIGDTIKLCKK